MTIYIKKTLLFCLIFCVTLFTGCSDNNDETAPLTEGQGEVTFKFLRNKVYSISTLEEMARLKVTVEKDGKTIVLPVIDLSGNEDELTSSALRLDEGTYKVLKYVAYNNKGTQVQEAYVEEDNIITIQHGEVASYYFPISIRIVYVNNEVRNMLFGICEEVLGSDSTLWPKSWRVENEDLLTWENLEFEVDDYGAISYLAAITFDGKTFPGMKKLPNTVSLFATIESIQIKDIPEFEELPDNLDKSPLRVILIMNTGLKEFPKKFEKMKNLNSLTIINSKLTEIPERLAELPEIRDVEISGNDIASLPEALADKWEKVIMFRMNNTKLTSLPANIFKMKQVSTFDFCDNPGLSSLPETRGDKTYLGGLWLDGCSFTSIPKIANTRMRTLSLANNKLTSVSGADLNALSDQLLTLRLDGNKLNSFPKMQSVSLEELSLNDCGLTEIPDLSALPALKVLSLNKNSIKAVPDNTFSANEKFAILRLSDNQTLTSFSNNAGFTLIDNQPYYLNCVDVDNCPNLNWTVPATWCCIKNFHVWSKEELELAKRNVIVYNRNSPKVIREVCPVCGKSVYSFPKAVDEIIESLNK